MGVFCMEKIKSALRDESGEIGVKQIAVTVAVIVIIGLIVSMLKNGLLERWVEQVWNFLMELIEKLAE